MCKPDPNINEMLVIKLQSGDKSALVELVRIWHKPFCEQAYWMVKDKEAAKDIAQESWAIIIEKINTLSNPKVFKYWAYRIVCNRATDWLRLKAKRRTPSSYGVVDIEADSDDYTEHRALKSAMKKAIDLLPENQKAVLKLFYIQDYTLKQISQLLNVSVGTVKSRLFYAREKLKKTLKQSYYEN